MALRFQTIVGRRSGPRLLIVAGVHGDEWEPMAALQQLQREIGADDLGGWLTLIPVVNEAAYRLGQRVGEDGIDLARVCPGRPDGSATERIAFELAELMRDADYFIDLHTGGVKLRLWPLTGYLLHHDPQVLEQQRRMARAFNLPFMWGTDPICAGRTLSVARDLSVPAIYAEYLGSVPFSNACVSAYLEGCRNVMIELKMLEGSHPPNNVAFMAEDPRPGAGHLQVCHPAPADGMFWPVVELGDEISAGTPIGRFIADSENRPVPIVAEQSGRIVALRSVARVVARDGLGVVVSMSEV
jgi:predicted deacylase